MLSLFEFGSPPFVQLREHIWLKTFEEAARANWSFIFTFHPEASVNPNFIERAKAVIGHTGGQIRFVELTCPEEEIESRIENESRAAFKKLNSRSVYRHLRSEGALAFPKLPIPMPVTISPPIAAQGVGFEGLAMTFAMKRANRYSQLYVEKTFDWSVQSMAIHTAPQVTALQAQATANLFLSDHLPDRFTADQPQLIAVDNVWRVPIILVYPGIGSIGCVGDMQISTTEEKVIFHTPLADMKQTAQQLYNSHRDAIEAAFS